MTNDTPDLQGILRRIEALERQNRRLKRAGLAVVVLAAVVFGMAQTKASRTVEAQEFIMKDDLGTVRARFSMEGVSPAMLLFDDKGHERLRLWGGELSGNIERQYRELGLGDSGSGEVDVYDAQRRARVVLSAGNHGAALNLLDERAKSRAGLSMDDSRGSLTVSESPRDGKGSDMART